MPDLPDFYSYVVEEAVEAGSFIGGADAAKPASPVAKDIYFATDTKILYICVADGAWTGFDAAILVQGILTLYDNLAGGGFQLKNIADPTAAQDAVTLASLVGYAAALVHAARHQNGGLDEISVTGLSGLLADDQHVIGAEVLAVAAALVHAARHQDGGDDEISIAGLDGEPSTLTTHKALTTGVHGVGADYLAKAAASQYTAINRAGDTNLGETFRRAVANEALRFYGGTAYSPQVKLFGKDKASEAGYVIIDVPNAAKNAYVSAFYISGVSDSPEIYPFNDNLINLGTNTKRWKLVRAVTGTFGDMNLENGWGFTEHPEHGVAVRAPSGKLYKMNLEEIK